MIDLYVVLQVDRGVEPEVIRAAYRALARKNHPDFGGDVRQMATLNEAWAVLSDPARRAAYDAEPQALGFRPADSAAPSTDQPANGESGNGARHGLAGRRPQQPRAGGSVLDFGRYEGWTVGSLLDHDPDYLEWLSRTPIGRPLVAEIDEALARRAAESPVRPSTGQQPARRRAFL
jgi:curved DNA-binding protein CbpA